MRVLVIMTGGTIGSKSRNHVLDVCSDSYYILEEYNRVYPNAISFETIQPLNTLSENFTLATLETLGNALLSVDTRQYNGIIITHGSDTLCYTSAYVGMLTRHFNIPVVMVASNYALDNPLANGLDNFHGAVSLISSKMVRGCFVVWKDSITSSVNIHIGTRLRECDSYTDNFQSFGGVPFGEVVNGDVVLNTNPIVPTLESINHDRTPLCDRLRLVKRSMLVRSYTGLDYSTIDTRNVDSILVYLYHSGTACTVGGSTSLLEFISRNSDKSIYVASLKMTEERYSTANEILNTNVIPLYNTSVESAYIKTLILNNLGVPPKEVIFFEEITKNI